MALFTVGSAAVCSAEGLRLSGFGTVGYAADDRSDIAVTRDISQLPRNSYQTGDSWRIDSRLGLQLEYRAGPYLDLVGQLVVRDQFVDDFNHSAELAYAAIKARNDVDLRLGRINYDAFLMSDHRNVGYAYSWVRPPTEFYGWIPIFSLDGIDAAYTVQGEEMRWRIKAQAGQSSVALPIGSGYEFEAKDLLGLSLSVQSGSWRVKAAYSQFTAGEEVPAFAPLHQGLDQVIAAAIPAVSSEAADLRHHLSFKGARISYATLGAAYDDGRWMAQAELGHTTATAAVIPHGKMAYLSVGRRVGDVLPYLLISTSRPRNDVRAPVNDWGALNAALRAPAYFTLNATRIEQDTLSAGARWDLHRQAALKLQWDHTTFKPSGYGLVWRDRAINLQKQHLDLLSVTLDFVF